MKVVVIAISLWMVHASACEFLYPVAAVTDDHVLVIYQKNPSHLELWNWNPQTQDASPALLSRFTPAGVRLLPSKKGYSFVDHGVIKIKTFQKRSPRTIELDTPLHTIELLNWIDDTRCYTHAVLGDRFGIFEISTEGEVMLLVRSKDADCLYPQIVGEYVFYIERRAGEYSLKKQRYSDKFALGDKDLETLDVFMAELIVDFSDSPCVFLFMPDCTKAYVISHPKIISKKDTTVDFSYSCICLANGTVEKLFDFTLPAHFIFTGASRLYEALLPFLPRHVGSVIYYSDCAHTNDVGLYAYDSVGRKSLQIYRMGHETLFAPLFTGKSLLCGGLLSDQESSSAVLKFNYGWMNFCKIPLPDF